MAGFEVVVRPMVLPNIRPLPARVLVPEQNDDPDKGKAVITGGSGKLLQLSYSYSGTATQVSQIEVKREYDVDRVYQREKQSGKDPSGQPLPEGRAAGDGDSGINKENYVDIERIKKVWFADGTSHSYATPPPQDNIEVMARDQVRLNK